MKVYVKDKGLLFDTKEFGYKLIEIIEELPKDEENELVFEKGIYNLNISDCITQIVYMTNTVSEKEMEFPIRKIGIKLENVDNLTLNGNGATLLYEGRMTEFYLENCKNVTIKNFVVDNKDPSVAEFDVVSKNLFAVEIKPTINSKYQIDKNKLKWGCEVPTNVYVVQDCKDGVTTRVNSMSWGLNPFARQLKAKKLDNGNIKVILPFNTFKAKTRYQLRNQLRDGAGFFISRSKNIVIDNMLVHFMHGMGVLCQVCENITVSNSKFIPNKEVDRTTTAFADMVHCSMCRGLIKVVNNEFDGAHDDVLNVHGNHFRIKPISERVVQARWMHPQAYGFNPFDKGDQVEFIDKGTLTKVGENKVVDFKVIDPRNIELTLENEIGELPNDCALEIASKTPDLIFENNIIRNIPTRGVLCTTRGKVLIKNNKFYKTHMAAVLISDDAQSWYESGYVRDVTIEGNLFDECQGYVIDIYPEAHSINDAPIVHKNINITNNEFILNQPNILRVKRSANVEFKNNKIKGVNPVSKVYDSENINVEF